VSVVSDDLRSAVETRAVHRCEYCRLPTHGQVARFPIDHVDPRSAGGQTELDNLALSCPTCNAHKWAHTDGFDSATQERVALFNPRRQLWTEHFQWLADDPAILEGKTPCGRATIERLQINDPILVATRRVLRGFGITM
jgi:hypothetical protein